MLIHFQNLKRAVFLAVILLFGSVVHAQDRDAIERLTERLTERLDLSSAQVELVRSHVSEGLSPEDIWQLSAALAPTLSDAQQARLNEAAQRPERQVREAQAEQRELRLSAERPERQAREAQRERREARLNADREERPRMQRDHNRQDMQREERTRDTQAMQQRREAHVAARNAALNLTDEQIRQLEAPRLEQHSARDQNRMQSVLTEEQAQIWKLHSVLSRTLR